MESLCKHNKKNIKTLPVPINAGVGGLGMIGGIVLLGGALVTATIVSTLAFRSKSQRRKPSPEKSMSSSPETQSFDAPNKLELMMDTDLSPRSEEVVTTSMEEIHTKNIPSLTLDKKDDYGMDNEQVHSGDSNEAITDSVVSEDQENTRIHVDSALESEEQVVMAAQIEKDSCLERDDSDGEEQKHLMMNNNENDEYVDANSLASNKDIVSEASEIEDNQEIVFMNEAEEMEVVCVNQVKVEDNLQERLLAKKENDVHEEIILDDCDLSDDTGYTDQIIHELVMEKEASDAVRLLQIELRNCPRVQLLDVQEEIVLESCEGDLSDKKGPADQIIMADDEDVPDNSQSQLINKEEKDKETTQNVEEQVLVEDEAAIVDDQTDKPLRKSMSKDVIPHVESIREDYDSEEYVAELSAAGVSSSSVQQQEEPRTEAEISYSKAEEIVLEKKVEMIIDHESVKKDEIPHVEYVNENEDNEEDIITVNVELNSGVSSSFMQEEPTQKTSFKNKKIDEIPHVESVKEDEDSEEEETVKTELSSDVGSSCVQDEPTPEAKISYNKTEETVVQVKSELITIHELVKKDEIQHVESVNEDEDSEEDVTVKDEPCLVVGSSSVQEEPTLQAKIGDYKVEENTEENQNILGKNDNDSNNNGLIKEQSFARKPRNLKLMAWFVLISVWCICHWYSELPFPELSLVGSLLSILVLLGYRNRATYAVKYE